MSKSPFIVLSPTTYMKLFVNVVVKLSRMTKAIDIYLNNKDKKCCMSVCLSVCHTLRWLPVGGMTSCNFVIKPPVKW